MNKKKIIIIVVVAVLLIVAGFIIYFKFFSKAAREKKDTAVVKGKKVGILVCSHIAFIEGGSKAQNNLGNIQLLLDNNIDMIEMDVQITEDNVPVLFHDGTLDKVTDGTGKIQNKTLDELKSVRYNADRTQGIAKLSDAIDALKKSNNKETIFQLDKCDAKEIEKISQLGLFDGVKKQMLTKASSFTQSPQGKNAGVMYMPIIPSSYVGTMNKMAVIDEIVNKSKGCQFLEAQFSDADSLLIDGTLSNELSKIDCRLMILAVVGTETSNGKSFRGDNKTQWGKMITMKAGVIMTNKPLALKKFINTTA